MEVSKAKVVLGAKPTLAQSVRPYLIISLVLAPKDLVAVSPSTTTLEATVVPQQPSKARFFTVELKGIETCRLVATTDPLTCKFDNLTAATEYTLEAKACRLLACSLPLVKKAWTIPTGKFCSYFSTQLSRLSNL